MQHEWVRITEADPEHSVRYAERFRTMAEDGHDLGGEARMIDAMVARGARILDAGCGPGRVGAFLAEAGHDVVGVDIDPVLIEIAERDHPGPRWIVGDLAELDLSGNGVATAFDAIVCAGNVMTFLHPSTRVQALRRMGVHLADDGRLVVGFGAGRGYEFTDFFADVSTAGLAADLTLSTWDLRPFDEGSAFVVAVLRRASA
ncbi:MAG: class I SAM-dependent methyltransferase [Acidimicrobiales bacterium]